MSEPLKFWHVDAFTEQPFTGNPAAIFVLDEPLDDAFMQSMAIEMNLSETAYILLRDGHNPLLRWFTPTFEVDLCGHATLASAHILMTEINPELDQVTFDTKWVGPLTVKKANGLYCMNFPSRLGEEIDVQTIPKYVLDAISGDEPHTAYQARDIMLVYKNDQTVIQSQPNFSALQNYDQHLIITAPSSDTDHDFVSRFIVADAGISEDPVTGSAHCTLTPYWAKTLGKAQMTAYQASKRGGTLYLEDLDDRVQISGKAITMMEGKLRVFP